MACAAWIMQGAVDLDARTEVRRLQLAHFEVLRSSRHVPPDALRTRGLTRLFPGLEPCVVDVRPGPRIVLRRRVRPTEAER